MKELIKFVLVFLALAALVIGWGWCQWIGYKDRYPHGGCVGFVTSCGGQRK